MKEVIVLRRKDTVVPGQVYLAGLHPLNNALVKIAICHDLDDEPCLVAQTSVELLGRPAGNWLDYQIPIAWRKMPDRGLSSLTVSVVVEVGGKVVLVNKRHYPYALESGRTPLFLTIVAEPVGDAVAESAPTS